MQTQNKTRKDQRAVSMLDWSVWHRMLLVLAMILVLVWGAVWATG
jgi:hypothetical protein